MKNKVLLIGLLLLLSLRSTSQQTTIERPKLIVGIVVDQMRWDYLYRYYERYGTGGFKRLLNHGFSCENTFINYLPSYTAPGHASIYTGSVPSIHGIAGNDWMDNFTGRHWYCVEDTSVTSVGGSLVAGRMSPNTLLTTTITDELRLATNFKSKVVGISLKDRGSILPAGHLGKAYWYDDSTGNLITSSFYENQLPQWLNDFNAQKLPTKYLSKPWELLYPANTYTQSLKDDNPYEGKLKTEIAPVFPHNYNATKLGNLRKIPSGNTYTLDAAKAAIVGEKLGKTGTDFLCISLSATDYIGHNYTSNSVEAEDTYLRLDKDIATFLEYLDKNIGAGNYLVFLSADHGVAHNSIYMNDLKIHGGNQSEGQLGKDLQTHLKAKFNTDKLAIVENYQVVLNEKLIKEQDINRTEVKNETKNWLLSQYHVAYVLDMENIHKGAVPDLIKQKAINGYNRRRSGYLLIINDPGWYYGYAPTGTTHSTWHPYDTHIPLLFYGWKIPKGKSNRTIYMEDIAATLAALLHIQMPNGCIGNVITEVVK